MYSRNRCEIEENHLGCPKLAAFNPECIQFNPECIQCTAKAFSIDPGAGPQPGKVLRFRHVNSRPLLMPVRPAGRNCPRLLTGKKEPGLHVHDIA